MPDSCQRSSFFSDFCCQQDIRIAFNAGCEQICYKSELIDCFANFRGAAGDISQLTLISAPLRGRSSHRRPGTFRAVQSLISSLHFTKKSGVITTPLSTMRYN